MRVTKTMKEVIEQRLTEKRIAADNAASADYNAKRKACIAEIEPIIEEARDRVAILLNKHGMDASAKWCGEVRSTAELIVGFDSCYIRNNDERDVLSAAASKRYKTQQNAMQNIIFDAEAGGDKESLLAAIAAVNFDVVDG